ncbi:GNAT family N-acetyltransferase [Actinomyces sp. zg328]|uniref:GNAT family N-acetyltransferase n=1 Tax=Actinomyces sp. zg328 TaxID=2609287 RepID=UPI0013597DD9|nr:GNAT family N-acetyltransferase [Actinomyces sp. zg328]
MNESNERRHAPSVFDADPVLGLSGGPGGGRGAQERGAEPVAEQAGFVRPARESDLPLIGRVHAATMLASMEAGHASAHGGAGLPDGVRAMIAAPVVAAGWEEPVTAPPSPQHHVLVATRGPLVVGLVGLAPTQGLDDSGRPVPGSGAVEVTAIGVAPEHQRQGHGSRLLAAAVDLAREDGARALLVWALRGDESMSRLFTAVGMAPTGMRRELPIGDGVVEDCWAATI